MNIAIKTPRSSQPVFRRPAFVLVGMMRSGSNFLERQFNRLLDVRCHGELFNPDFIGFSHDGQARPAGYTRDGIAARDADEQAFATRLDDACDRRILGLRLFIDHSPEMSARLLHDRRIAKIVLSRNLLESYVSLQTARATNVWLSTEQAGAPPRPVEVDIAEFTTFALRQSLFYNDVLTLLHRTGQRYVEVDYAQIKQLDKLNELARFIGSVHAFTQVVEPIQKQNIGPLSERIAGFARLEAQLKRQGLAPWML